MKKISQKKWREIRFQVTNIDSVLSEPEVEVVEVAE